jgi:hypothetical protein
MHMMNDRFKIGIKLIVSHIFLVTGLLIVSAFIPDCNFMFILIAQTVLLILYFAGYWEFFGLKFKWIFCSSLELVLIMIFVYKLLNRPDNPVNIFLPVILSVMELYLLAELVKIFIVIMKKDKSSTEIAFPFKNGIYLVTDGGNSRISRLMNYHYYSVTHKKKKTNKSMLYATDIVRIDNKKYKWLPLENSDYPIFNENVYSPMDGIIAKVVNGIPDNEPYAGNYPYNTGNTVVIQKDNYFLLLGHLKNDSIVVSEGDTIHTNEIIGSAGNSGWTERPHLHMQLIESNSTNYWYGTGICITFNNKNLFKNRLIKN